VACWLFNMIRLLTYCYKETQFFIVFFIEQNFVFQQIAIKSDQQWFDLTCIEYLPKHNPSNSQFVNKSIRRFVESKNEIFYWIHDLSNHCKNLELFYCQPNLTQPSGPNPSRLSIKAIKGKVYPLGSEGRPAWWAMQG